MDQTVQYSAVLGTDFDLYVELISCLLTLRAFDGDDDFWSSEVSCCRIRKNRRGVNEESETEPEILPSSNKLVDVFN